MKALANECYQRQQKDRLCFSFFLLVFFIFCVFGGLWSTSGAGFVLIYSAIWMSLLFLFFYFPVNKLDKKSILLIMTIAIAARGLIFLQAPSDDLYRYLWEGSLFKDGINPYLFSPDHNSLKEYATAYPPFLILIFSLITSLSLSLYSFKAVMVLFDLAGILFLIAIIARRKINSRWIIFYALNPLILYSFAGEGHFDSIQNFFLLGALFFYDRKKWGLLFLFAGLAIQVKYVALIALPFFINRDNLKFLPVVLLPIIVTWLPFLNDNTLSLFSGISQFEGEFAFNGSVNSIIRLVSGKISTASFICRILFSCFMLWGILKFNNFTRDKGVTESDPVKGILYAFACLIIFAPTFHIWYLSWILPFAVIRNSASWLVLSLSACFYYLTKSVAWSGGEWIMPCWAQIFEWLPFFIFFAFELYYSFKRGRKGQKKAYNDFYEIAESLSVIIPVLNEENKIAGCIESVKKDPAVTEIIVVDGGSEDNTVNSARLAGATVLINKKSIENGGGRGGQIIKGINSASGDIIAIVHADTLICSNVFSEIKEFLKYNSDVTGGAVGTVFDTFSFKTKLIEFLNGLRVVFFGISFGDQIQFFKRKQLAADNNLFPDIPLMEDLEFSLKLPKTGRRVFLFGDAIVSSRRWQKQGLANFFMVLRLFFSYLLQRIFKMPDVVKMYRYYYK